jgi:hypothetical protein
LHLRGGARARNLLVLLLGDSTAAASTAAASTAAARPTDASTATTRGALAACAREAAREAAEAASAEAKGERAGAQLRLLDSSGAVGPDARDAHAHAAVGTLEDLLLHRREAAKTAAAAREPAAWARASLAEQLAKEAVGVLLPEAATTAGEAATREAAVALLLLLG